MAWALSHLELFATLAGFANIYLAARASVWNFIFGIVTVSLYLVIFLQVKLYADMSLQVIFLVLQFYGIYCWLFGGKDHHGMRIEHMERKDILSGSIAGALLFNLIAYILYHYTDSTTIYLDAITTSLSLIAQWMMSRKWIEHWWLWFVVNIISIDMYIYKSLYYTAGLYSMFIILNFYGYKNWKQNLRDTTNKEIINVEYSK